MAAMAAHRASFPLRLQQILAGSRAVSPAIKVESEPPENVKAFIDRVINIPLHDIAIPLSGFRWEFSKGNFHHWKPLFMHFDTYFKTYISSRKDLLLSDDMAEDDPLPKNTLLKILRVMQIVLENCQNKSSFSGLEHFKLLLASSDPEIVVAALETLAALVKINPSKLHMNGKLISCGAINSHLLSLAQGWGSKEEGLGLYSCVVANERNQQEGLSLFPANMENTYDGTQHRLGSTLHFEYNAGSAQDSDQTSDKSKSSCVIHIPDMHLQKDDDLSILKQCIEKFNVPSEHRFALFTRIRYAHAFNSARTCRLYSRISLLAFIVLVQSSDAHDELTSFFTNEPEYINELIRLVRSEEFVPGTIRALAMLALGAQLTAYASSHERARILSGSSIISAGGNRMVLLSVLQKAISSLNNPNDTSSPLIVDALLQFFLLHVLSSSSSGTTVRGSGMVPPLLPLLQDNDPSHMHLVCLAVKTLQKLMEYSSPAVSLFKDLGGVELLSQRLHVEVQRVTGSADAHNSMVTSDAVKSEEGHDHLYSQKRLIKALLKALGSATYSPGNPARSQNSQDNSLPVSLSLIFHNVEKFGGDIYFSAVTVMSEIIHKDPTCFPALKELGLPDAFLSSVNAGVVPSRKALICVPNGLGAICLNNQGLEAVREKSALRFLVETFTSRKYLIPLNEGVVLLANAVEELLRHVQSLRSTGVDIIIEIINKLCSSQEERNNEPATSEDRTDMETDVEGHDLVSTMDSSIEGTNDEQFCHLSIFHVMVLVHRTMENSETCRLFVEKGGLQALLTLLLRPSITQSSGGMPIALHSTMVFKGFTQHHSTPLARAFCSSLKEHLKNALQELDKVSGSNEVTKLEKGAIPSLFVVEFLLFLAASKDNRWMNALLSEFGDASKGILEDIGRVHREVLWQISRFEEKKIDPETSSSSPSTNEAHQIDSSINDIDDNRYTNFRHYLDPLLRRRGSGLIESQMSDLINIYRDIGRATGETQRGPVLPSSSQDQASSSSDANASTKSDEDKKRSEHSSCCDMMRSLSYHINNLFMELGKAMLLTSRRENSPVNLSPSVISVAGNIASVVLEHLNFEGHTLISEREISVATKCRYLGKVVEFIDGILLDRPESCNPIMVNSFYCHGVIQAILTTFQATSELLFTVNRPPSSPMETDGKTGKEGNETDSAWIYGPLSSYGAILDHLVTSSFILSSSTRQLLEQPIFNVAVRYPQDAEKFVKLLQSMVLKTVLPLWTHPQFPECNIELISSVTSILRHVCSGVEVKNTIGNGGARLVGPPPDENAISLIVEMGFSRARAEEALRQVGTNSVEIATDWLFSHPEEPQEEDDELARALAMSLGNSDASAKEEESKPNDVELEEETVQLPPIDEILYSCLRLLQTKETLAFPVRDMLVTISSQNDGQNRAKVITYLIDNLKECVGTSDPSKSTALCALFHVLALILHGDTAAREIAAKACLVKIALDLLTACILEPKEDEMSEVPNWVASCFLSVDRMLQLDPKLPDVTELDVLGKDSSTKTSVVIDDSKKKESESLPSVGLLDLEEQKQLVKICCKCIQKQLPSATMHAILQLCATLTKVHVAALCFLESDGLNALLSLPTKSLFSGFNNVASTIIRHILEDPHTLQQAMELEIRHSLVTAANRHANPRVTPRNFVQNLAFVVYRDPVIFMKAAQAVCQIEMVGDRPYVLLKDRDKEKSKEKEKDKSVDKDKATGAVTKVASGDTVTGSPASAHGKQTELSARTVRSHRKPPQSFVAVIEHLLDLVMSFVPPPRAEDQPDVVSGGTSSSDMDIDCNSAKAKGKGKAVAVEESKQVGQDTTASLAKSAFVLKLLTDVLLTYASSIQVVLRHDVELSSMHGPNRTSTGLSCGGIFNHILHHFLPHATKQKKERKTEGDWRYKLATRANQFLVAASIRSAEGRKRILSEVCSIFVDFIDPSTTYKGPISRMNAYVDLLNDILSARSPTGSSLSAESVVTFVEVGLVQSLSRTLQVLDLDHPDSAKLVTAIVKALEVVTKEHVHSADLNAKGENSSKIASENNNLDSSSNRFQALDTDSQPTAMVTDHRESTNAVQTSQSSDSVADEMDHDRDMDGGFARDGEDDFMHDMAEDGTGNESTMEIRFEIPQNREDDMADDDEENDEVMSGDDGEEVDEDEEEDDDDEENNNLEEDDAHQMSHPDTDHDDREMDEEEFDDDLLEEDEDEDEDEEGVILRLEEGINGINVFDHIEVFGGSNNLTGDTLRVMPLDIFGTRRQGRSTSVYNLLGRASDHGVLDHPLLEEPSSMLHLPHQGQPENIVEMAFSDRNHESSSSRLDAIFRSLRSTRNGHRFNMWLDDSPQRSGSAAPAVPEGIEELLISHLRRPTPEQPDGQRTTNNTQENDRPNNVPESEAREVAPAEPNENNETAANTVARSELDASESADPAPPNNDALQRDMSNTSEHATEMQYERSEAVARDVEAVSQASSGSGATLGESLRSLEVEIGSVEGHDDGDRHGASDRLPLGDIQAAARSRRPSGSGAPISSRDVSLESVSEVPQIPNQESDQNANEGNQEPNRAPDADSIDPTFLEALPEDLRAEVLSSRQNQVAQTSNEQTQSDGDIDPEFLAALPPDIREEVLAQQRAQRLQQSQELEGQPVEMDAVSIIATFPSEIREEVLLTSPDTLLATLTPALVAEANMLRERFAHRYHSGSLFGMNSRNRRGESSRRAMGSSFDTIAGDSSRSTGKPIETEGAPLVDKDALNALIRLLRVVQPLYKGQLQRLLLNLCAHRESRKSLVQILVDMLMLDLHGSSKKLTDGTEQPFRLFGCHANITYSRPQSSNGVPPLVSRRVLETLTYLARSHPNVAKLLLFLELPCPSSCRSEQFDQRHGKAVLTEGGEEKKAFAVVLLLTLLNQPLYMRSVAHLEQLLNLLEVVMLNAENEVNQAKLEVSSEKPSGAENAAQDAQNDANVSGSSISKSNDEDNSKTLSVDTESNLQVVLQRLPQAELRLLCSLLAHDGLSDNAYLLVAQVLKKIVALAPFFCFHFINELAHSMQNLTHCAMKELRLYEDSEKALLSSSSANGTAILRVVQALSSLVTTLQEKKDSEHPVDKDHSDALSQISEINTALDALWLELSNCISKIESSSDYASNLSPTSANMAAVTTGVAPPLPAGTQNILPYIESFFVTCEKLRPGQPDTVQEASTSDMEDASTSSGQKSLGGHASLDEKHNVFVKFSEKHRRLLNAFIRQNPGLLEKSFSLMLKIPRLIDFDNKRAYFRSKIKHQHDHHHSPVRISVRRAYILEDSYNQLRMRSPQDLKGRLTVHFQGEEGIDAGGLTREWYQSLSRVIFDKGALLFTTVGNDMTFQPNPNSVYQTEHLSYFKFVGRVVGKALFDGQLLDAHFTRSFYKHILGVKVTYHDIEAIDPAYYKNLKWMLENDISDILDLTFSMDADEEKLILYEKAEVTDCELIPGGRNIRVTEENKHEYVDRVAEHRLTTAIRPQINAFLEGFNELIPRELISIFNDKELELLISGLPDIDLDDLKANTEYSGYSIASPVIQWFWEIVQGLSKEDKARFLQFVTGTSKVPLEGFSALQGISGPQRFQIHKAYGSTNHLPSAHTCFNQLDLPEYTSKEQLQERLLLAIHEANEGFGFG